MSTVGFIGLGTMGAPMAENLLRAGYPLVFYARREEVIRRFSSQGARPLASPAEVAAESQFVITIVTADPQVEEVALGPQGLIHGAGPGKTLLEMSTTGPWTARKLGEQLGQRGMAVLDAPVSGGPWGAQAGTLTIMVGGPEDAFQRALPLLEVLGEKVFHVGPLGAGQTVKLVNQLIAGGTMALVAEGLLLARAAGVDLEQAVQVIGASSGNSAVFQARARKFMLAGNYEAKFSAALMHKDMQLARQLAAQYQMPQPVAASALEQYTAALAQGLGSLDFAAVARVYEQLADRSLAVEERPQS